jgi:hypothetical protein
MKIVNFLFLLFSFFPFITPIKFGFDSQPWAFFCGLLIILNGQVSNRITIPKYFIGFFFTIIFAFLSIGLTFLSYGHVDVFSSFRSLFSILSIPICLVAFVKADFSNIRIARYLEYSVYLYFSVALIQFFIPSFLTSIISRGSTSEERGLYSLAPEPVEYARICFLLLVNLVLLYAKKAISLVKFRFLSLLLFCQAVLFSMAGTAFIWALLFFVLILINSNINKLTLLFFGVVLFFTIGFILEWGQNVFPEKRVFNLVNIAVENPQLLTLEGGFVLRLLNPIHSVYVGIILNSGIGVGLGYISFGEFINYDFLGSFFENVKLEVASRSHGGLIGLVYELGILSFPFILTFFRCAFFTSVNLNEKKWINLAFYFFLILTAFEGPLSSASVALTLAMFFTFKKDIKKSKTINN